ncbi:tyrosine-type recombinase/integrase [Salinigranum salinum]|uniref:tyrosine-type recombinase/integrase n=1 Tax=Salinigranum salinum TaxID=1364937 RepID=UPI001F036F7D|nr:site-specific integrase [Salinigranum salinum]
MYLTSRESELAASSLQSHEYRLNHFIRWCESEAIENMNTLTGRQLHTYGMWRKEDGDLSPASFKGQMDTLRVFIRFCESIDAVRPNLHDKVLSTSLSPSEKRRTEKLSRDEAAKLLDYLTKFHYASFEHTLLTLLWHTGLRTGGVYGLDVTDYQPRKARLKLRHRPESETPLKNQSEGERLVALSDHVCEIVDDWLDHHRPEVTDEYGRSPLLATEYGRPHKSTVRDAVYRVTRPCEYTGECPHGRDIETCEAQNDHKKSASACPSSLNPHAIRRGSITHFLTKDVPEKVVSDRMNVSTDVLEKHYDERSEEVKVEQRRGYLSNV